MKPSGIPWLGDIPEHWQTKKLKYVVKINALTLAEQTEPNRVILYIDIGSVDAQGSITRLEATTFEEAPSRARRVVSSGDVLVSTVRTYLKAIAFVADAEAELICSTGFAVLTAEADIVPKYMFYWTRSDQFIDQVVSRSTGVSYPAINALEIGSIEIPLFDIEEQQAIAAFLDRKTAAIDALIRERERQIALLNEQRQALISHAVTRGLDPDAPLRPSGIAWLGDIPAHWRLTRMKFVSSIQTGPFGSQLHAEDYIDNGIPIINPANIENGYIVPNMRNTVDDDVWHRLKRHALEPGDIIFGRRGEMGRCAVVTSHQSGWLCGTGCLRVRLFRNKFIPTYLYLQLCLRGVREQLLLDSVGSTMDNLNTEILGNVSLALQPVEEQQAIIAYLDRETKRIDAITQTVRTQIDALRTFRQALVSSAVTGKIDVRAEGAAYANKIL